jgi:hypothetical protein
VSLRDIEAVAGASVNVMLKSAASNFDDSSRHALHISVESKRLHLLPVKSDDEEEDEGEGEEWGEEEDVAEEEG